MGCKQTKTKEKNTSKYFLHSLLKVIPLFASFFFHRPRIEKKNYAYLLVLGPLFDVKSSVQSDAFWDRIYSVCGKVWILIRIYNNIHWRWNPIDIGCGPYFLSVKFDLDRNESRAIGVNALIDTKEIIKFTYTDEKWCAHKFPYIW